MKKILLSLGLILTLLATAVAQTPLAFNYQAVVRNADNQIVANQMVTVQISLLQGSADGTIIFTEEYAVSTNANGLFSLLVGESGTLGNVDWSEGPYFIRSEVTIDSTSQTITNIQQLLSVPYALYAERSHTTDAPHIVDTLYIHTVDTVYLASPTGLSVDSVWEVSECGEGIGDFNYYEFYDVEGTPHIMSTHVTFKPNTYIDTAITATNAYNWHGTTYTSSGDYYFDTIAPNGCTQYEELHLTIEQTRATVYFGDSRYEFETSLENIGDTAIYGYLASRFNNDRTSFYFPGLRISMYLFNTNTTPITSITNYDYVTPLEGVVFLDYYENTYYTIDYLGDWQPKQVSIIISSIDRVHGTVSFTVDAIMYSFSDYNNGLDLDDCSTTTLRIEAFDIQVEGLAGSTTPASVGASQSLNIQRIPTNVGRLDMSARPLQHRR
ncbi:MAG: hypothetical protein IJ789_08490 [Bacteroidales bacterium]|nr:hypothetical protein [Bacteroidales bacterium]